MKTMKGLSTNWQLRNSHGDVKYTIGNTVSNTIIIMYGAGCILELSGGSLHKVYKCLTTTLYTLNKYKIILNINNNFLKIQQLILRRVKNKRCSLSGLLRELCI